MSTQAANARLCQALLGGLADVGLRRVFVCPGGRSAPLVRALEAEPRLSAHVVLDERAAAFLALGSGRADGAPAAVICTSGSAPAHFLPAVVEADRAGVPLLLISADRPRELQECGAPQTIDQRQLLDGHTRWFFDFGGAEQQETDWVASAAAQAWARSQLDPAGPVHLNVPLRDPFAAPVSTAAPPSERRSAPSLQLGRRQLRPAEVEALARRLASCQRGAIVCGPLEPAGIGGAAAAAHAGARIGELADRLGWPLLAEPASQARFSAAPCQGLVTSGDALLRSSAVAEQLAPELVLRLGQVPTSKAVCQWLARQARGRVLAVDGGGRLHDPMHAAQTLIAADALDLCQALIACLPSGGDRPGADHSWRTRWLRLERAAETKLAAACAEGLWEGAVARAVLGALPAGARLHLASSMPIRDLDSFGGPRADELVVFANRGANGIDGTIATAGGEALACAAPMVALVGDLALRHDLGGIAAVAQLPLELTIVVLDNGGGGIFDFLPIAERSSAFERYFTTPQKSSLAGICSALAARHRRITRADELAGALKQSIATNGLDVIEVTIDRADNHARHQRAWEAVTNEALALLEAEE